jgi:hypothetical protein
MAASATYLQGSYGRIRTGSNVVIAGITKWTERREVGEIEVTNFESIADANTVIEAEHLSDNISNTVFEIEGFIDYTTTTTMAQNRFAPGTAVTCDFLNSKVGPVGRLDVSCFVKSVSPTVELKQGQKFTATLRPYNTIPVITTNVTT